METISPSWGRWRLPPAVRRAAWRTAAAGMTAAEGAAWTPARQRRGMELMRSCVSEVQQHLLQASGHVLSLVQDSSQTHRKNINDPEQNPVEPHRLNTSEWKQATSEPCSVLVQ